MNKSLIISLISIAGGLVAVQGAFNAQLGKVLSHPLQAALVSFMVGTIVLISASVVLGTGLPMPKALGAVPPHHVIGFSPGLPHECTGGLEDALDFHSGCVDPGTTGRCHWGSPRRSGRVR